jgi:hypothetical protein
MKTALKGILITLIAVSLLITLPSCEPPTEEGEKSVTMIIISDSGANVFPEKTDSLYLGEVLDEMVTEGDIAMTAGGTAGNRFISKIGALEVDPSDQTRFICIYTDEDDVTLVFKDYSITYENKSYYSAALGMDQMPLHDGKTYVFKIVTF